MDAAEIERFFSTPGGDYAFARWNRPLAPVVFGVDDVSIPVLKGAIQAVAELAGVGTVETDPELGSNLMQFYVRNWDELAATPNLHHLVPELGSVVGRLQGGDAQTYRLFRYDEAGAIRAVFQFVRMSGALAEVAAETLALTQAVQAILTWGAGAFADASPLALHPDTGAVILRPEVADLIRAAYDPVMPVSAYDASHALRLAARVG